MKSTEYQEQADRCLARVVAWLEGFDPDELDFTPSDGVVTLEFGDGAKFVLNRQSAARQMWLAAGARAWHFDWDDERDGWFDDKEGSELLSRIGDVVSSKLGRTVSL